MPRYVVAIASGVGGGKTTLTQGLAARLGDASAIFFDHYERFTRRPIEAVRGWMSAGADPNALDVGGLAADLRALKRGERAVDPANGAEIEPRKYLLLDAPFGRRHDATGREIDLLVWIDTPLDIALARKLRQLASGVDAPAAADYLAWMLGYLENYLAIVAELLRKQRDTVRVDADLVVDGEREPGALLAEVEREIRARLP